MVKLGAWSTLLLVLAVQALLLAALLLGAPANRLANRYLALLLLVIVGLLIPFIIGYAGAYDAWPWLSFAPFAVPLALGPALYGHVRALTHEERLARWHWYAPALQFLFQAAVFPWPVDTKDWVDAQIVKPVLSPLFSLAVLISMAGYGWASGRTVGRYARWLEGRRRHIGPAARLRTPVVALGLLVTARAGYELWDSLVEHTDYFDLFGYFILVGVLGVWIGAEGWRRAGAPAPPIEEKEATDWNALGQAWIGELRAQGWWRDPTLSLARLARLIGTNESHLSRALNAAGGGFAEVLNAARADAAAERLRSGDRTGLLDLAMACGFGSKASFNRAFRSRFGATPSEYRAAHAASDES